MYNGYTYGLTQAQKVSNELETLQKLSADGNAYWQSRLSDFIKSHPRLSSAAVHKIGAAHLPKWIDADIADLIRWSEFEDGTEPSPYISGGEVCYPSQKKSAFIGDIPF